MSYSTYTLNNRISNIEYQLQQIYPFPVGGYVPVDGDITVNNIKTFSSLPVSSIVPVNDDELVNKKYVDDKANSENLSTVLINGNSAGNNKINMNYNAIDNILNANFDDGSGNTSSLSNTTLNFTDISGDLQQTSNYTYTTFQDNNNKTYCQMGVSTPNNGINGIEAYNSLYSNNFILGTDSAGTGFPLLQMTDKDVAIGTLQPTQLNLDGGVNHRPVSIYMTNQTSNISIGTDFGGGTDPAMRILTTTGIIGTLSADLLWLNGSAGSSPQIQIWDSLGNHGLLTSTNWNGTSAIASTVSTTNNNANLNHYLTFVDSSSASNQALQVHGTLIYNPNTNILTSGTFSGNLTGNCSGTSTNATNVNTTINTTSASNCPIGFFTFGSGYQGVQVNSNLNFQPTTNTLRATTFEGALTGTATNANAINTTTDNSATTCYLPFIKTTAGTAKQLYVDDTTGPLSYTPSTSTLTATNFSGLATNSTNSVNATNTNISTSSSSTPQYISFVGATTGNNPQLVNSSLTYTPSTNTLTATNFSGLATNATNSVNATNATNTNITTSSSATPQYLTFVGATTGNNAQLVNSSLTYTPSTNTLTATNFSGLATNATNSVNSTNINITSSSSASTQYLTFVSATSGNNAPLINSTLNYTPSVGNLNSVSFTTTSDRRIKDDITEIKQSVAGFNPVRYYNKLSKKYEFGFIADELPEDLVVGEKNGIDEKGDPILQSVNYIQIIALLTKEIIEMKKQMKEALDELRGYGVCELPKMIKQIRELQN